MATQPTVATEIQAIEKSIGVFFDAKHLILAGLLAVAVIFGVYHFVSRRADAADARAAVATAVAKQAADDAAISAKANTEFQAQTTAAIQQLQQANAALAAQNVQNSKALVDALAVLKSAQQVNVARNPNERAARWHELVPGATVSPVSGGGYTLNEDSGLATLNALESLPVQGREIELLNQTVANQQQIISNDGVALKKEQDAHKADTDNDGKQLVAANKANDKLKADYDQLKDDCRKSKFKWFGIGVVVGFIGRHAAGF